MASLRVKPVLCAMLVGLSLMLSLPAGASASARGCRGADARPGEVSTSTLRAATRCLINRERRQRGIRRLRSNRRLARAARRHAADMVRRGYVSHFSRPGTTFVRRWGRDVVDRIRSTGYLRGARSWTVGENLGAGAGRDSTPRATVRYWMGSRSHRGEILARRYRHIGVGVARGSPYRWAEAATYVTDFGVRR